MLTAHQRIYLQRAGLQVESEAPATLVAILASAAGVRPIALSNPAPSQPRPRAGHLDAHGDQARAHAVDPARLRRAPALLRDVQRRLL